MNKLLVAAALLLMSVTTRAQKKTDVISAKAEAILPKLVEWRRHFHEHPELSNREYQTSRYVAAYLRSLGLRVDTGIAHTGVVAILNGGKPGPCIALRADMDALPIREHNDLPFASRATGEFLGEEVPVMHACGHDAHTAILMATAAVLTSMKKDVPGTVKFIFQPSEEGAPEGEDGGASLMVKEGVMKDPEVDAVYGLHMHPKLKAGAILYKAGAFQASSDRMRITVNGKGSHGSQPWAGIDPVVVAAQIIMALQTIVSRQEDLSKAPVVITIGRIEGGVRNNIIPDRVEMWGTIRTLDAAMRLDIQERIRRTVEQVAASAGASAVVDIREQTLVNFNNPELTAAALELLQKAAGPAPVSETNWSMTAEDFSYFGIHAPTLFFFLGGLPEGRDAGEAASWHTPEFFIDESKLHVGVKAFCYLVLEGKLPAESSKQE